jgi:hypothetical protein
VCCGRRSERRCGEREGKLNEGDLASLEALNQRPKEIVEDKARGRPVRVKGRLDRGKRENHGKRALCDPTLYLWPAAAGYIAQLWGGATEQELEEIQRIYFSQRGSRTRQAQLEQAVRRGVARFESRWATQVKSMIRVEPQTAVGEPCLQVIDYMNWAVYRAFVKGEMRYYHSVEDKVSLLVDLYDVSRYPRNWYTRENPFDIEKASPL